MLDGYVLLCFVSAFVVILLQTFSKMGVVNEPVWRYAHGNTDKIGALDDAPDGALNTGSWVLAADRIVQVPWLLVVLGGVWVALHVVALAAYVLVTRNRRETDAFWRATRTNVWVGPVEFDDADEQSTQRADAQLRKLFSPYGDVADVILWTPEAARRSLSVAKLVGAEPYRGQRNFAIVKFTKEDATAMAIAETRRSGSELQQANGAFCEATTSGHLSLSYLPLTSRPTYERLAGPSPAKVQPAA